MAGDWIPIRLDLASDPAVIAIAARLDEVVDEDHVVGKLVRLWGWVNEQTPDGNAPGVTAKWIDRYLGVPGFADALTSVGWLVVQNGGVQFPKFDRWNAQSGKTRALTGKRVQAHRAKKRNASGVTKMLPEKRREEDKKKNSPPTPPKKKSKPNKLPLVFPPTLDTPTFRAIWASWETYRRERHKALTPSTVKRQLKILEEMGHDQAIKSIEQSIGQGWTGLFGPKECQADSSANSGRGQRAATRGREYPEPNTPLPTL